MVLPALLMVYEHFYRPGRHTIPLRSKLARYLPLWAMTGKRISPSGRDIQRCGSSRPAMSRPNLQWGIVLLTAVGLVGGYLWKLLWWAGALFDFLRVP